MQSIHIARYSRCIVIGLFSALFLTACATTPPLYSWGQYEEIVYSGYKNPGSSDPVTDGDLLAADIERTESAGLRVAPGVRLHLGYLLYSQGRDAEARNMFEMERQMFPESAVFVDGLLSRMGIQ